MQVRFSVNDQSKNLRALERLIKEIGDVSPREIVHAVCDVAIEKLTEFTPRGRTGRFKHGWAKLVKKVASGVEATVFNKGASDEKGAMILNILDKGARYRSERIFPRNAKALRFVGRTGEVVFSKWAATRNRRPLKIISRTMWHLSRMARVIAARIVSNSVKRSRA